MLPKPLEYAFVIEDEPYLLVECSRGGQERYRREFALAIAAAPAVLDSVDGVNLLAQAVARQCLRLAPEVFWKDHISVALRHAAATNGHLWESVYFEAVPLRIWEQFRKEVDAFMALLPQPLSADAPAPTEPRHHDENAMEPPEIVPAMLRGRAQ